MCCLYNNLIRKGHLGKSSCPFVLIFLINNIWKEGNSLTNNSSFSDVIAASDLISAAGIVSTEQLNAFLRKRGLNEKRMESVKKILLSERFAFADPAKMYFSSSKMTDYRKFTDEINKCVWLFIDSLPTMNYINFKGLKPPCIGYIDNSKELYSDEFKDFTVFYISKGSEAISSRIINTNYGGETSTVPAIIIIDDPEQIQDIVLDEIINVVSYAVITNNGRITYYN